MAPVGPLGGWEIGGKVSKVCFNFQHGGDAKPFGFLYRVGYGKTKLRDENPRWRPLFLLFHFGAFVSESPWSVDQFYFGNSCNLSYSSLCWFIQISFVSALLLVFTFRVQTDDNMDRWPIYECNWALVSLFLEQQVSSVERPCWLGRRKCLARSTVYGPPLLVSGWERRHAVKQVGRKFTHIKICH